ncbi:MULTISPECIES: DUF3108 domain-containing protein [unclassified Beijerinckia]|uniref:DUF3108 domain-containing protein n=1 Tax=unclassified Beijerinckia TaxID=2638183 RepID=UPI0014814E63|nr:MULTISPECIES: DUF3108 domain-containing protein [unclassified Beijerinckia]
MPRGQILAALSLAALALPCASAQAETLHAAYSVRIIGLTLGTAGLVGTIEQNAYRLEASAKLAGIASALTKSEGGATSTGAIVKGRVLPATYASASQNTKETRTVRMALNAGTVSAAEIVPPADPYPDRIPVTEAQKRGIIDPLSALVMPVSTPGPLVGPQACARTIPIYDGITRFDVPLSYVGTRHMDVAGYSGPVAVCSARYRPISGHRPDREATRFMAENKQMEVWLAPLEEARALAPIRITVATMIGMLVIEATRFQTSPSTTASTR